MFLWDAELWRKVLEEERNQFVKIIHGLLWNLLIINRLAKRKWVLRKKLKLHRSIEKLKARLLTKDFNKKGVDYLETFYLLAKFTSYVRNCIYI